MMSKEVAVVAELHDVVDAHAFVAVVVVVGLPHRAERIHGDLPVVAEVPLLEDALTDRDLVHR